MRIRLSSHDDVVFGLLSQNAGKPNDDQCVTTLLSERGATLREGHFGILAFWRVCQGAGMTAKFLESQFWKNSRR
jgi:hypothetical protein